MAIYGGPDDAPPLTLGEFDALFRRLRDATAWGPDDRRGALNNLTPSHVLAAVGEVRSGHTVSLAAPIETVASQDNPDPCSHEMAGEVGEPAAAPGLHFAMDSLKMNVHGNADSHIDALCHVIFNRTLYNGVDPGTVAAGDGTVLSIDLARDGIRGTRGAARHPSRARRVMAGAGRPRDSRRSRGSRARAAGPDRHRRCRVRPGRPSSAPRRARGMGCSRGSRRIASDRAAAAGRTRGRRARQRRQQRHRPQYHRRRRLPDSCARHQRDGPAPAGLPAVEELAARCVEADRWSFLCVIAPLRLPSATGSPVNPIAIL